MLNQCTFIGNLGADPDIRNFPSGGKVCNLRIAVSERWTDKQSGERKEYTEWVPVSIFSEGLIRVCEQYLKKGSKVFIQGKFKTRKYQDQSGNDRYSTEVVLQGFNGTLTMLDGRSEGGQSPAGYDAQHPQGAGNYQAPAGGIDDEIPFALEWRA